MHREILTAKEGMSAAEQREQVAAMKSKELASKHQEELAFVRR